jgi:hypothetical protein
MLVASILVFSLGSAVLAHDGSHPQLLYEPPGHDKPGPPLRNTDVLLFLIEHPNMDDGIPLLPSDAEVSLTISVAHAGHGSGGAPVTEEDLDFDETLGDWLVFEGVYAHLECTPMNPLVIFLSGFEADATNLDAVEKNLLSIAAQIGVIFIDQAIPFAVDSDRIVKLVSTVLATLNPDDSLGKGSVAVGGPGVYDIVTSGGKYSITATFDVASEPVAGGACDPDSSYVVPPPELCFFSSVVFDSLLATCNLADQIQVEDGNPGEVTAQDLADAKATIQSTAIEIAHWVAAHMVEDARGLSNFSVAISYLNQGEQDPSELAILDYRAAFCSAESAIMNNVPDPSAPPMAPRAIGMPRLMATREGRTVDYLVGVFGDGSENALVQSVTGGPPGASFTLEAADPGHPSWHVLHVAQDGPPGTYGIQVQFTDPQVAPLQLTLDIDEETATGVDDGEVRPTPEQFALLPVRPNPVVQAGSFWVELPDAGMLDVGIYDVTGRRVRDLAINQFRTAGRHIFAFDARSFSSGVYYVRMSVRAEGGDVRFVETRKFVVTR